MTITPGFLLLNLRIVGLMMVALVVINLFVPKEFHWREEMARLSLLNRQIFQIHSIFLTLVLGMFAALLLAFGRDLLEPTRLARAVLAGLTAFWVLRMLMQWFFYSPEIWRGDRFKTIMHGVFSVAWVYVSAVFATALWISLATAASTP
jgi:hypothetical protein